MNVSFAAIFYVFLAIGAGALLADRCFVERRKDIVRIAACWAALTVLMFLAPSSMLFMVAAGAILLYAAPREPTRRLMFYCAMLPAAPAGLVWEIPFPGVQYLLQLHYPELVNLTLLLPLLVAAQQQKPLTVAPKSARLALNCAYAFVALSIVLDFRSTTITNGLRNLVEHVLMVALVLLAVAPTLRQENAVREAVFGLIIAGLLLATIGIVQHVTSWIMYINVADALRPYELRADRLFNYRDGRLRIPGTMSSPIPYGMYMAITAALLVFQRSEKIRRTWVVMGALVAVYALYLSVSRGAQALLLIILLIQIFYTPILRALRPIMFGGALLFGLVVLTTDVVDRLVAADEYGTVSYRLELLENASASISRNPLLGSATFRSDEKLQQSRQGQGIIDVVNAYLRVVLQYGFLGLLLFVVPLMLLLGSLMRQRANLERMRAEIEEADTRLFVSIIVAYAVAMVNVSMIDRLGLYFWFLVCVAYALVSREPKREGHVK